jgi:flavin-dependent thymidylate synthase
VQIKLAGYNIESEIIDQLPQMENAPLTPETFSSAYARISRSSKDVTALRKQAREDVQKARKSNQRIIFQMGHHSVAEHAVFNFDVIGVSRLALEEIEKFRLASYTEKSQRYVTLDGDFVLPKEIHKKAAVNLFQKTIKLQNDFYFRAYDILKEYLFKKYPEQTAKKSQRRIVEGWAKEDARYILSLATEGQLGLTINARNLEHLFRRFALSKRTEIREIGKIMFGLVEKIAPSLILFPEPSAFESALADNTFKDLLTTIAPASVRSEDDLPGNRNEDNYRLEILDFSKDADDRIIAALLVFYKGMEYPDAYHAATGMSLPDKLKLFKGMFEKMEFFDSPSREFELPDITFQAIVSASNFAQLKRHRMATLISGNYGTAFGNVVPENIKINGLEEEFYEIIDKTNNAYEKLKADFPYAADYILTNSHCRRIIMKMNLREVYHFSRLRGDEHAQWDIRNLALQLTEKVKKLMPLSTLLLCGKSDYVKTFETLYGKKPAFLI